MPLWRPSRATASSSRDDTHVFALQAGKLIPLDPETVSWKPNSFRTFATLGLERGPLTGTVPGPHSDLVGRWPPMNMVPLDMAFYILTPKNGSATDFQLLHLSEHGDRREFRTVPSDRAHGWGVVEHTVPFTLDALAPRVYKVTLPNLNVGEYGLLAPITEVRANSTLSRQDLHLPPRRIARQAFFFAPSFAFPLEPSLLDRQLIPQ